MPCVCEKVVESHATLGTWHLGMATAGFSAVDTLDIAVWLAATRKRALRLGIDDWVSIDGAVRRRFWQAPTGLASRWQVEASQLRKL